MQGFQHRAPYVSPLSLSCLHQGPAIPREAERNVARADNVQIVILCTPCPQGHFRLTTYPQLFHAGASIGPVPSRCKLSVWRTFTPMKKRTILAGADNIRYKLSLDVHRHMHSRTAWADKIHIFVLCRCPPHWPRRVPSCSGPSPSTIYRPTMAPSCSPRPQTGRPRAIPPALSHPPTIPTTMRRPMY